MAYNSYSGNRPPANSRRVNIEPDEDRNTNFDREGTQLDTQGNIVSTAPPSFNETGQIKFRRDIYSPVAFKQKVDTSFSELNNQSQIDIPTFFREYNRLFFDIPKQGANSHETIINESRAYFQDYQDPKDLTISNLNTQINELNSRILELELEVISGTGSLGLDGLLRGVGDPSNPNISWNGSVEENGLQSTFEYLFNQLVIDGDVEDDNDNKYQFDTGVRSLTDSGDYRIEYIFFERGDDDWDGSLLKENINQAFEKADFSDKKNVLVRTYSEWRADIDSRSSQRVKRDARKAIDYLAYKITGNESFITSV